MKETELKKCRLSVEQKKVRKVKITRKRRSRIRTENSNGECFPQIQNVFMFDYSNRSKKKNNKFVVCLFFWRTKKYSAQITISNNSLELLFY